MKTYILELPVSQTNEEADSAWASDTLNNNNFVSKDKLNKALNELDIDKYHLYTLQDFVSRVNNGNDLFTESYIAEIRIS